MPGMLAIRALASFHPCCMIQESERSCRVASCWISWSMSSGKYSDCFRFSLRSSITSYTLFAPTDARTSGPLLLRLAARRPARATPSVAWPSPSARAPAPAALALAIVSERVHRESSCRARVGAARSASTASPAAPTSAPAALVLRRAGDLPHLPREEVEDVLVRAEHPSAAQLLIEAEHADQANVLGAPPGDLGRSAKHREPVAREPGRLRDGFVESRLHGFALRAALRLLRRRAGRDCSARLRDRLAGCVGDRPLRRRAITAVGTAVSGAASAAPVSVGFPSFGRARLASAIAAAAARTTEPLSSVRVFIGSRYTFPCAAGKGAPSRRTRSTRAPRAQGGADMPATTRARPGAFSGAPRSRRQARPFCVASASSPSPRGS